MEPIDQPNRISGKPLFKHCNQLNWGHNGTSFHVLAWVLQGFIGMVEQVHMRLSVYVLQVFYVFVNMCLLEWWNKITCVGMFVHSTSRTKFTCVSACLHVFLCGSTCLHVFVGMAEQSLHVFPSYWRSSPSPQVIKWDRIQYHGVQQNTH